MRGRAIFREPVDPYLAPPWRDPPEPPDGCFDAQHCGPACVLRGCSINVACRDRTSEEQK